MMANAPDVARGSAHDCGCGCGGTCTCDSRCCDLECLIRPNYFCGQTLTDRDLTALVEWARTRFGLVRYRAGWGVVGFCPGGAIPMVGTLDGRVLLFIAAMAAGMLIARFVSGMLSDRERASSEVAASG